MSLTVVIVLLSDDYEDCFVLVAADQLIFLVQAKDTHQFFNQFNAFGILFFFNQSAEASSDVAAQQRCFNTEGVIDPGNTP